MSEREHSNSEAAASRPGGPPPRRVRWWRRYWIAIVVVLGLVVLALIIGYDVSGPGGSGNRAAPAVPVIVAPARRGTFVVYQTAPGTVAPINRVVVHSRVDGRLARIAFKEGQMVSKGDLLAVIDAQPFQVQLQLATGKLASDQALLANARATLKRYQKLRSQNSIAPQRVGDQESQVAQYAAAVKVDQGHLDMAQLQLSYTHIKAPISGMVGLRNVDPGNLVGPSNPQGIVVITQLRPTSIVFSVPADVLPQVLNELQGQGSIAVDAFGGDKDKMLGRGRLLAANNQVDPATGTVKLKAAFANADGTLFPNQFVSVKLPIETLHRATLVPSAAIQHGSAGAYVYVITQDGTVAVTPVQVGPGDATTSVIDHGVTPGATVVIEGVDGLRDGTRVEARPRGAPASAASTDPHGASHGLAGGAHPVSGTGRDHRASPGRLGDPVAVS